MIAIDGRAAVWFLLAAFAVMIAVFLKYDRRAYVRFKQLTETADRQRCFRRWLLQSAVLFGGGSVLALAVIGRLSSLSGRAMPVEFAPLAALLPKVAMDYHFGDLAIGLGIGLVIGVATLFVVLRLAVKKNAPRKTLSAGDIESLLPRNGGERIWALLIALNAGWCEELFFRLMLPLLLTLATGNVFAAFGVAVAVFGAVHLYQGVAGIVATAVLGALFSVVYLATGNIWIAAALHAVVDINGLILQPLLRRALSKN